MIVMKGTLGEVRVARVEYLLETFRLFPGVSYAFSACFIRNSSIPLIVVSTTSVASVGEVAFFIYREGGGAFSNTDDVVLCISSFLGFSMWTSCLLPPIPTIGCSKPTEAWSQFDIHMSKPQPRQITPPWTNISVLS